MGKKRCTHIQKLGPLRPREWRSPWSKPVFTEALTRTALKMSCPKARPKTVSYNAVTRLQYSSTPRVSRIPLLCFSPQGHPAGVCKEESEATHG